MNEKIPEKVKLVISDCHLSAGRFFNGKLNSHEDFFFDNDMCDLFEHFSSGKYEHCEVELIIAGDYFDFLNVPVNEEFEDAITEEIAVYKVETILNGHPKVMEGLRKFASLKGKSITYLIGNHDAELFFEKVREKIIRAWDPEGAYPSTNVRILHDTDRISIEGGVEIHHGCQFEAGNELDYDQPMIESHKGERLLNIPWGSIYVLKIINRMKWEREFIDKIRPIKMFVVFGLIFDTWFTLRFVFLSIYYFIKTRLFSPAKKSGIRHMLDILREETKVFQDLEEPARKLLDENENLQTVIFGHTHRPMDKVYPDGKQYINTGTWTKMIDLDWRGLGQQVRRTFALIQIREGQAQCELRQWVGEHGPHKIFHR